MSGHQKLQFDRYAHSYRDLHRASIRASGEEPDYFAAYKIAYMASRMGGKVAAQPLNILDFGCGVGASIPHLAEMFPLAKVHGLDVSSESIDLAEASNPQAVLDVINETQLPLADGSMDVAMAACVYHHIAPIERQRWTRELRRVLKPGGYIFIFEHNPLNPLTQKVVRDCPFDDDAILLPRSESLTLLRDSGFDDITVNYIVFFPRVLAFLRPLEKLLVKLPLGAQYAAHGRAR